MSTTSSLWSVKQELVAKINRIKKRLDSLAASLPEKLEDFAEAEERIRAASAEIGRNLLQAWSETADAKTPTPICDSCQSKMRHKGYVQRSLVTTDHQGNEISVDHRARFLACDDFGRSLLLMARASGYHNARLKAFVADGARWLWDQAATHFPDAIQILDWYHLSEHIHDTARELYGQGTPQSKRFRQQRVKELWEGRSSQTVRRLQEIRKKLRSKSKRESLRQLIGYLKNNRERINYPNYRELGLQVGSGRVEAACKSLVAGRCKQSGMRNWTRNGARFKQLETLSLDFTDLTDAGVAKLRGLNIQNLSLSNTNITDQCASTLSQFHNLRQLDVYNNQLTDKFLTDTCRWQKLIGLDLRHNHFTDASVKPLSRLKSLEAITIFGNKFTDEGAKKLQQALPNHHLKQITR